MLQRVNRDIAEVVLRLVREKTKAIDSSNLYHNGGELDVSSALALVDGEQAFVDLLGQFLVRPKTGPHTRADLRTVLKNF